MKTNVTNIVQLKIKIKLTCIWNSYCVEALLMLMSYVKIKLFLFSNKLFPLLRTFYIRRISLQYTINYISKNSKKKNLLLEILIIFFFQYSLLTEIFNIIDNLDPNYQRIKQSLDKTWQFAFIFHCIHNWHHKGHH